MRTDPQILYKVLSAVGLEERMTVSGTVFYAWDKSKFYEYSSRRHRDDYTREMDEIYRISELCLLHWETGLRITFTASESYFGETVDYHFYEVFIITKNNERHTVQDIDIEKQLFYTKERIIPFSETDNQNLYPEIKKEFC